MEGAAFERALRPLLRRSGAYAFSILRERKAAEDAVQQAALHAWQRRGQFNASCPFAGWWYAILRNHCLDTLRRTKRMPTSVRLDDAQLAAPADEGFLNRRALERAMEQLSEAHRETLKLRYFGDLSYEDIAAVLEVPKGTVMSRLHLARKALATLMQTEAQ